MPHSGRDRHAHHHLLLLLVVIVRKVAKACEAVVAPMAVTKAGL